MVLPTNFGGVMTKQCNKCDEKKDVTLFRKVYQYWTTRDGIKHKSITNGCICLDCFNSSRRKYMRKIGYDYHRNLSRNYTESDKRSSKKYFKKCLKNLSDPYIKQLIARNSSLSAKDITDDLIKLKRRQVKLSRLLKLGRCAAKPRS